MENPVVTVIKNREEKVITFNMIDRLNPDRKLGDIIYNKTSKKDKIIKFLLEDDVEFIYMKNYVFKKDVIIGGESSNTILILENPVFEGEELNISNVDSLEIIKPIFRINGKVEISNIKDVNIVLDDESSEIDMVVKNVNNLVLESSSCLLNLSLDWIENITLRNFNSNLRVGHDRYWMLDLLSSKLLLENSYLSLSKKELRVDWHTALDMKLVNSKIVDCDIPFGINSSKKIITLSLEDSMIDSLVSLEFSSLKYLNLKSSSIKAKGNMSFEKIEKITFFDQGNDSILDNSSYLEAKEFIKIKDQEINNLECGKGLILDKNSIDKNVLLKRQELKYVLKKYKEKLEEENAKKVKELEDANEQMLKLIEEDNDKKVEVYKRCLENKRIRDL